MELVAETIETRPGGESPRRGASAGPSAESASSVAGSAPIAPDLIGSSSDDALVRASVGGQQDAFSELVRRYTNMVLWFSHARLRDPLEAEEVTQESMVRAYEQLPRLRAPGAFANWLLTITTSVMSKKRRRDSKIIHLEDSVKSLEAPAQPTAIDSLSDAELRERIVVEMNKLPAHYRVALALKYLNGYSVDEISERLQVPGGTVRARLSRAYGMLRKRLGAPAAAGADDIDEAAGAANQEGDSHAM